VLCERDWDESEEGDDDEYEEVWVLEDEIQPDWEILI
jgi:hypothetical protein